MRRAAARLCATILTSAHSGTPGARAASGAVDRSAVQLEAMYAALAVWLAAGIALLAMALRYQQARLTGAAFGCFAGGLGGLDPFLKGVSQNLGGTPHFVPDAPAFAGIGLIAGGIVLMCTFGR